MRPFKHTIHLITKSKALVTLLFELDLPIMKQNTASSRTSVIFLDQKQQSDAEMYRYEIENRFVCLVYVVKQIFLRMIAIHRKISRMKTVTTRNISTAFISRTRSTNSNDSHITSKRQISIESKFDLCLFISSTCFDISKLFEVKTKQKTKIA